MDDIDITVAGLREDVQCLLHDLERKDAEIEQLKRQLQESRADHTALQRTLVGDTGASAIIEAERLRIDAHRYRWLRERDLDTIWRGGVFAGKTPENLVINQDDLDIAIDTAMEGNRDAK